MLRLIALLSVLPAAAQALTVSVTFSDKAAAELAERGEVVTAAAYWMGDPVAGSPLPQTEIGTIFLGAEEHTFWPGPVQVTFTGPVAGAPTDQVTVPMVNVNVYTARHTDEFNLISCDFLDAPVADLEGKVQPIHCKLIGE
jgi:hypothetical protein